MDTLFIICAIAGGTVLAVQLVMSLLGIGGHSGLGDFGGDGGLDIPHDMSAHLGGHLHDSHAHDPHHSVHGDAHSSSWYFGIITLQTVVAAVTFFGLSGKAASAAQFKAPLTLVIALAGGGAAMYGVHAIMRALYKLRSDGTERIANAVGREGTVYLGIPARNQGLGKIHMSLQSRLVEYAAMTSGNALPTGAKIVVVDIVGSDTVSVEPLVPTDNMARV